MYGSTSLAPSDYTEEAAGILSVWLYDAQSCDSIIEHLKGVNDWTEAKILELAEDGGYSLAAKPEYRSANAFVPVDRSELVQTFNSKMNNVVKPLVKRVWQRKLTEHSTTHIVRYKPGDYYRRHSDEVFDKAYRYFSVVCYLNEDFEGGHTSFPPLNYSVTPQRGKAIIFPSTYVHCAEPVTSGEKYVLVSWLTGPAPIRWI